MLLRIMSLLTTKNLRVLNKFWSCNCVVKTCYCVLSCVLVIVNLPSNRISKTIKRKPPTVRMPAVSTSSDSDDDGEDQLTKPADVSTQVELISDDFVKVQELTERAIYLQRQLQFTF